MVKKMKRLTLPLSDSDIKNLKAGETVLLSGTMLTGRDAAHKRLYELVEKGEKLPIDIKGELIYYVGPAPAKPGFAVGPAGPTSSYRMDKYAPTLLDLGLKGMIGKGARNQDVIDAIVRNGCVYFLRCSLSCPRPGRFMAWKRRMTRTKPWLPTFSWKGRILIRTVFP